MMSRLVDRARPSEKPGQPARRCAVYTAIFGSYDRLHLLPDPLLRQSADFICFTDDKVLECPGWNVRLEQPRYASARMSAKYFKAVPHIVLPEYEETIWIDGSFRIEDPAFVREILGYLDHAGIALFQHPDRICIYEEAAVSKQMPKYADQDIDRQVRHYREQGYPEKNGLFACGVVARRRDDPVIRCLNELWLRENLRFSCQDQVSLPFLLWKLDVHPVVFLQHLWRCRWGSWEAHTHDR
jgi:hypothetical protein